jgi:hypothetical protein
MAGAIAGCGDVGATGAVAGSLGAAACAGARDIAEANARMAGAVVKSVLMAVQSVFASGRMALATGKRADLALLS